MGDNVSASASTAVSVHGIHGKFRRIVSGATVAHGHVSPEICETVFRAACQGWGITSSTEAGRNELLGGIAEAVHHATSSDTDTSTVTFAYDGEALILDVLRTAAATYIQYDNPLRVWVVDFRRGIIPCMISDMLDTPENVSMRQIAAAKYGANITDAKYCFDTSGALLNSGRVYSLSDRNKIGALKMFAVSRAQGDAQSRGLVQAGPDGSNVVGGSPPTPVTDVASSASRGGFRALAR